MRKDHLMKIFLIAFLLFAPVAKADYFIKDGNGVLQQVKSTIIGGAILSSSQNTDPSGTPILQSSASSPINISTATTVQIVPLISGNSILVTSYDIIAGGTGTFGFVYGTGTNCGTGQQPLTGAYPLASQAGIAKGNGSGVILKVPQGNALCATTSAAVQMSGSLSYIQGNF